MLLAEDTLVEIAYGGSSRASLEDPAEGRDQLIDMLLGKNTGRSI